jgi:hypothetical protein
MIEDLDLLATRIRQLTELTQSLRDENAALGKTLAVRDAHIRMLRDTIANAQQRVDNVLARLPGEVEPTEDDSGHPDVESSPSEA